MELPTAQLLEINAVIADDADHTAVTHGENAGHTPEHVAAARSLMCNATVHAAGEQQGLVSVPAQASPKGRRQHLFLRAGTRHQMGL